MILHSSRPPGVLSHSAPIHHTLPAGSALHLSHLPGGLDCSRLVLSSGTSPLISFAGRSRCCSLLPLFSRKSPLIPFARRFWLSALDSSHLLELLIHLALVHQALLITSPLAKPALTSAFSDHESHQVGACMLHESAHAQMHAVWVYTWHELTQICVR